ncbi:hypothetical protein DPMN_097680 [Dreissena polymorpha]|uniref:Uncharacterized protein n=1 Tax=Dreissena polymorpha TaxID=45954 RepID=A0A9D4R4Y7_DREPO|nr:hypothetical protein DPMN_097680 [Dreissena polymorpha]
MGIGKFIKVVRSYAEVCVCSVHEFPIVLASEALDSHTFPGVKHVTIKVLEVRKQEHRLAGADRSSIFFLKVKGLSFSITKEGGVE